MVLFNIFLSPSRLIKHSTSEALLTYLHLTRKKLCDFVNYSDLTCVFSFFFCVFGIFIIESLE